MPQTFHQRTVIGPLLFLSYGMVGNLASPENKNTIDMIERKAIHTLSSVYINQWKITSFCTMYCCTIQ